MKGSGHGVISLAMNKMIDLDCCCKSVRHALVEENWAYGRPPHPPIWQKRSVDRSWCGAYAWNRAKWRAHRRGNQEFSQHLRHNSDSSGQYRGRDRRRNGSGGNSQVRHCSCIPSRKRPRAYPGLYRRLIVSSRFPSLFRSHSPSLGQEGATSAAIPYLGDFSLHPMHFSKRLDRVYSHHKKSSSKSARTLEMLHALQFARE